MERRYALDLDVLLAGGGEIHSRLGQFAIGGRGDTLVTWTVCYRRKGRYTRDLDVLFSAEGKINK